MKNNIVEEGVGALEVNTINQEKSKYEIFHEILSEWIPLFKNKDTLEEAVELQWRIYKINNDYAIESLKKEVTLRKAGIYK